MTVHDDLKAEAQTLGFSLLGITTLDPPPHSQHFLSWLKGGHHGGMGYLSDPMAVEKRLEPKRILPSARSMVCLAMPYARPNPVDRMTPGMGRVAAYAWGEDYHRVIPTRLTALASAMRRIYHQEIDFRAYTDTGPLLERDLAQRAGLGWMGKNTCLINPKAGSTFFLAEVIIDLALEPDEPFAADRCGTCQRCIQACPTGCIRLDRTVDARRCISYLTIENKGIIPAEIRPNLGKWIFGCDICQMVCPWNQKEPQMSVNPTFLPPEGFSELDLHAILSLTPQGFNTRFRSSPIQRARRKGLLRNACVAAGNQPDPVFLPALENLFLNEPEPLIRAHAVWAVQQISSPRSGILLNRLRSQENDPLVLRELMD